MDTRLSKLRTSIAAWFVGVSVCSGALADAPADDRASHALLLESPGWTDDVVVVPISTVASRDRASALMAGAQPVTPPPPAPIGRDVPPTAPPRTPSLDADAPAEEMPPACEADESLQRHGVYPYGGGHPGDWSWGCGGSPYRTGPGLCDDWKVGCRWRVAADGIVLSREHTRLGALAAAIDEDSAGDPLVDPMLEQFDHGPGGRVMFMSQVPHYVGYQLHVAYEGVEEWNAAVVFPKFSPLPGGPLDSTEQRSLHYRSSLHSAEINFVRDWNPMLQPFCGVRYIKFDDEINDFINQQVPQPLPGDPDAVMTDRLNLFDLENNLIGFQVGSAYRLWQFGGRLAIEGYFNAGLYYNKIKYTNLMGTYTTELADGEDPVFSNVVNNDVSDLSEIAYVSESSLTAVCRLNRCWALRAGYQMLGIGNVHLAEDAFLDTGDDSRFLFFHGWHAGVECRR